MNKNINNVGDCNCDSPLKNNTKTIELSVINYFIELWNLKSENVWGYVTESGTMGNLQGLYVGRKVSEKSNKKHVFFTSKDSHYSIFKIADILCLNIIIIKSLENGEIDYADLKDKIEENKDKFIIINVNLGTTMKGAIDNVNFIGDTLEQYKVDYYIHADGALSGFFLVFIDNIDLSFKKYIHSLSISCHKFLGVKFPCGIFIMENRFIQLVESKSEYIGSQDYMISCSRNGHSSIYIKYIIDKKHNIFKSDIEKCIEITDYLIEKIPGSWKNTNSITVIIKRPKEEIVKKWQLACEGDISHIVCVPHVTKDIIEEFIYDLLNSYKIYP
jgi:histidine decarboxylase